MTIWVNQNPYQLDTSNCSLLDLLQLLQKTEVSGIAVALNNTVISKQYWQETSLKDTDK
jgi:thiamine biosynthesis protein ThiS